MLEFGLALEWILSFSVFLVQCKVLKLGWILQFIHSLLYLLDEWEFGCMLTFGIYWIFHGAHWNHSARQHILLNLSNSISHHISCDLTKYCIWKSYRSKSRRALHTWARAELFDRCRMYKNIIYKCFDGLNNDKILWKNFNPTLSPIKL